MLILAILPRMDFCNGAFGKKHIGFLRRLYGIKIGIPVSTEKYSLNSLAKLGTRVKKGFTSKSGEFKTRGFNGEYEITVENKGKTVQKKYTLDSKGGILTIKL